VGDGGMVTSGSFGEVRAMTWRLFNFSWSAFHFDADAVSRRCHLPLTLRPVAAPARRPFRDPLFWVGGGSSVFDVRSSVFG
jgi:hypothetical protein